MSKISPPRPQLPCCAAVSVAILIANLGHAQNSQFIFEANGNLLVQKAETNAAPQIIGQPQNQIVEPGKFATFSVVAANTRLLAYQWRFNGTNLSSANSDTLLLTNVNASKEGEYRVVLTNPSGSVTSAPAFLMLDSDADGLADSWEMANFGNLNQYATGDFDGDGASNLQEFQDGSVPTNSNSVNYRLLVIRDGGSVIKNPEKIHYTNGESVTITATPLPGQESFHAWMGDILTRSNPVTLVMTNNKTVIARFTPILFTWTNLSGGDWNIAANWRPNLAPGSNDLVVLSSSSVTLNTPANCAEVTLSSGFLTGSGVLTVWKNFAWVGGAMGGSGRTLLDTNATLEIKTASVSLNSRTVENAGTIQMSDAGMLSVTGGGVITNSAGALFKVENATSIGSAFANGRFENFGTFRKSSSTGVATFDNGLTFNNSGTVEIETGTLRLAGGGTNSGTVTAAASTFVEWTGGTFALNPGAQLQGAGLYRINAGTVIANTNLAIGNLDLINGTLGGTGAVTINGLMNWSGGGMSGTGKTVIGSGATLQLGGSGGVSLNTRTLENGGTVLWTGAGVIGMNFDGVITNRAGALFHAQNAAMLNTGAGANRFDNAGTLRKSSDAGTTTLNGIFNNFGTVDIQTGTLLVGGSLTNQGTVLLSAQTTNRLAGGGSASGTFTAPAAALVEWTGGTFTLNPGAQLSGAGLYRINGNSANVAVNGDVTVQNLDLVNGDSSLNALSGNGRLTINNSMNWIGGAMSGAGRTVIAPAATLSMANSNFIGLQRLLENAGTVAWTGFGTLGLLNGVITNRAGAVFEASSAARLAFSGGACRFDNVGTFRKLGANGITSFDAGLPFNNAGTVDIRSGILAANGGFTSTSNALLNFALGGTTPGTNHGQLQVAGTVTLNGGSSVDLLPGFIPATNDTFTVLTAGTRSGTFASFNYPANRVTMSLSNTPNSVVLRVTNVFPVPQPVLLTPQLIGSNVLLTWTATSNVTYRLENNANVGSTNWSSLAGEVTTLSNTASKLDALTSSNRLYRVRVLP